MVQPAAQSAQHNPELGPELTPAKWSVADYHEMIAAGVLCDRRVELLDGMITEMPPVDPIHEDMGDEFAIYLRSALGDRAKIRECKSITLPTSEPQPDIAIVENRRYRDHHPYPENIYLLIEIAKSKPARDLETKRKIYARAGIREYWVLDLKLGEFRVFREPVGDGADYDYQVDIIWEQETIQPLAFPQVAISISNLFKP